MCTVKLSYDDKNEQAIKHLTALLATGLFVQLADEEEEFPGLDYNDPDLWKESEDTTPIEKEFYTVEEVYALTIDAVKEEYRKGERKCVEAEALPIPKDRNLSIDELEQLVVNDIRDICEMRDAV